MTDDKLTLYLTPDEVRMLINSTSHTHLSIYASHGRYESPMKELRDRLSDGSSDVYVQPE